MLPTWLRALARAISPCAHRHTVANPQRIRPGVEALEDRRLLTTFTVVNTLDDSNPGSLRRAIEDANSTGGADVIAFAIGTGAQTISPATALPAISESVTIDGTTQPGYLGTPLIQIDGDGVVGIAYGLRIDSGGSTIRGLIVSNFDSAGAAGIHLASDNNVVQGNWIGTDDTGAAAAANEDGLSIGGTGNLIGTDGDGVNDAAERNVISGNSQVGILMIGGGTNRIAGNYIGTDAAGTAAVPNVVDGIFLQSTTGNIIGTDSSNDAFNANERNIISGNLDRGIVLQGANVVAGNWIGVNVSGALLGNGYGIQITLTGSRVGTNADGIADADERNVISGSTNDGIIMSSTSAVIAGNYIGTDPTGTLARPNQGNGIQITSGGSSNTIGGLTAAPGTGRGNVISGNATRGIFLTGTAGANNVIQGNIVGLDKDGTADVSGGDGIVVNAGLNTLIGGTSSQARNIVSGHVTGINLSTSGTNYAITVQGNYIGTDISGTLDRGNNTGVAIGNAPGTTVGGTTAGAGNVISGNGVGVSITIAPIGSVVAGNFIGTNAAGTAAVANGIGVQISSGADNNTIGGTAAGARNVISGNNSHGIDITGNGTTGNVVAGNYIGTDVSGTLDLGNTRDGVQITLGADNNTVGGATASARNIISGNNEHGITIRENGTTGNHVLGNYIGTDWTGAVDLGNTLSGISVNVSASGNFIGGAAAGEGNVISGNNVHGVHLLGGASNNLIQGNLIGTDALGTADLGNSFSGVAITAGATGNTIGGTLGATGNVLSGNDNHGVHILGVGASGNVVRGNYIGTNLGGTADLGNSNSGVVISAGATGNTLGGVTANARNIISGNDTFGVHILDSGTSGNVVLGNYIGTNAGGTAAVANGDGVVVGGGAGGNLIGGSTPAARNVISGNTAYGVLINSPAGPGDRVQGNYIGTDTTGLLALGNGGVGVAIANGSGGNVIGTDGDGTGDADEGNVISGNAEGVAIGDVNGVDNIVAGNLIGLGSDGATPLGNTGTGVRLSSTGGNRIGTNGDGTGDALERNVISANGIGVQLANDAAGNLIAGNYIGTDAGGTLARGNTSNGIEIGGAINTIGGDTAAARNVISGNTAGAGILLSGPADNNAIRGNYIGTDVTGTAALGNGEGIQLSGGTGNSIGGTASGQGNLISGNTSHGIHFLGTAGGNSVLANFIGTDTSGQFDVGNGGDGVLVENLAQTIGNQNGGGNTIAFNDGAGLRLVTGGIGGAASGSVRGNSFFSNTGLGIDVGAVGPTTGVAGFLDFPVLTLASVGPGGTLAVSGTSSPGAEIDLYIAAADPNSIDEGMIYIATVTEGVNDANSGEGGFAFILPGVNLPGDFVTAVAVGSTSEFAVRTPLTGPATSVALNVPVNSTEGTPLTITAAVTNPDPAVTFAFDWTVLKNGSPFTTSTDASLTFTPDDEGVYLVSLTVTDSNGQVLTPAPVPVNVTNVNPLATIEGAPAEATGGVTYPLTAIVTDRGAADTFTYAWSVEHNGTPFGAAGTASTFDFTPTLPGIYVVRLDVSDGDGGTSHAAATTFVVAPLTATITGNPGTVSEGTTVTLSTPALDPLSLSRRSFAWSVTKNLVPFATGNSPTFSFTPDDNGAYAVTLTVSSPGLVPVVGNANVTVTNAAPQVTIISNSALNTDPNVIHLGSLVIEPGAADVPDLINTWSVSGPATIAPAGATATVTRTGVGTISVTLVVDDQDLGTDTDTATIISGDNTANTITIAPGAGSTVVVTIDTVALPAINVIGITRLLILGLGEDDTITASAGVTTALEIDGGAGNDTITGGSGHDVLIAGSGDNSLSGAAGDDRLVGGGSDTLAGGTGADYYLVHFSDVKLVETGDDPDTIDLSAATFGVTLNLKVQDGTAQDVNDTNSNTLALTGKFDAVIGSGQGDYLTAADATTLFGGDGNDTLIADEGSDITLFGDGGDDSLFSSGADDITLFGGEGADTLVAENGTGITLYGDGGNDTLIASGEDITLFGGAGDDTLIANGGDDITLFGDDGNDTLIAQNGTDITLFGGEGDDSLVGSGDGITLFGGDDSDTLVAEAGQDITLFGGEGDDTLIAEGGDNITLFGEGGYDRLSAGTAGGLIPSGSSEVTDSDQLVATSYNGPADQIRVAIVSQAALVNAPFDVVVTGLTITVKLASVDGMDVSTPLADVIAAINSEPETPAQVTFAPGLSGDTFAVVEETRALALLVGSNPAQGTNIVLFGGDDGDTLTANGQDITLFGGVGDDSLIAEDGSITLYGDEGNDTLIAQDGQDITLFGGDGTDTLIANGGEDITLFGGDGDDTLLAAGGDDITLFGGDGADSLSAEGGTDITLFGNDGNDTLIATAGDDITLFGDEGADTLIAAGGTDITLFGEEGSDTLIATNGDDITLYGGEGADTLIAEGGSDITLFGGSGLDEITVTAGMNAVAYGGTGSDVFRIGAITARVHGEEGNDTYRFIANGPGVVVTLDEVRKFSEIAGQSEGQTFGRDTLDFSPLTVAIIIDLSIVNTETPDPLKLQPVTGQVSVFLFGSFENVLGTSFADSITGSSADNLLEGGDGNDTIFGEDSLLGGDSDDTLDGGAGNNSLTGGGGNDTYRFTATAAGTDIITEATDADSDTFDFSAALAGVIIDLSQTSHSFGARFATTATSNDIENAIGGNGGDVLTGNGRDNRLTGNAGNDSLVGGLGNDTLDGGMGDDTMDGGAGNDTYVEVPGSFDRFFDSSGIDTLDFRKARSGITVNLGLDAGQVQTFDLSLNTGALTGTFENVIGSVFNDTIIGNAENNILVGRRGLDNIVGGDGNDTLIGGTIQVVFLDFVSSTDVSYERVYTTDDRNAIELRLETIFAGFNFVFTQNQSDAQLEAAKIGGLYATILFNRAPFESQGDALFGGGHGGGCGCPACVRQAAGGLASELDFGNINEGGAASVLVTPFLGMGTGQIPDTEANFRGLSATIAAHELGHLVGLRHGDSFGPIGSGIYAGLDLDDYIPALPAGFPENADETPLHVMASPASVHTTLLHSAAATFLGERELVKLAFADSGSTVPEQLTPHGDRSSAQGLGSLPALAVPNTLPASADNFGMSFVVGAVAVLGRIDVPDERDWYSFNASAGDLFNIELYSGSLNRTGNAIDSVLGLYDGSGDLVTQTGLLLRENDDEFETRDSILLDVTLPASGTYYLKVSTFAPTDIGEYELLLFHFKAQTGSGGGGSDTLDGGNGDDQVSLDAHIDGAPSTVAIDDLITVSARVNGAPTGTLPEGVTVTWTVTRGATPVADGTDAVLQFTPTVGGTYVVTLTASHGTTTDVETVQIVVTGDLPPSVTIDGDDTGVRGEKRHFTFTTNDEGDDLTYHIDWNGDNVVDEVVPGDADETVSHVFTEAGTYTVKVQAEDAGHNLSAVATHTIVISIWELRGTTLYIGGTTLGDNIDVKRGLTADTYRIKVNERDFDINTQEFITSPLDRIVIFGQAGDDNIRVQDQITVPAELYGGLGNDKLRGGGGHDILVGGEGDDLLVGNAGRDILIGGMGSDKILGNSDDDILVAGATAHDCDPVALRAIQAEWTSGNSYADRVDNLFSNSGSVAGLNNGYLLSDATVFDDGVTDRLTGDEGCDWFLLNLTGTGIDQSDATASEICTEEELLFLLNPVD